MCMECWAEYGSPTIKNEKTKAALALVKKVYDQPGGGAGGHLHIVLDDFNIEDDSIAYCQRGRSDPEWRGPPMTWELNEVEKECAAAFMAMTLPERASTLAMFDGFFDQGSEPEPEPEVKFYIVGAIIDYETYTSRWGT